MPIGFLLPKVFTLNREAFTIKDANSILTSDKPVIILIIAIIVLLVSCLMYFILENKGIVYIMGIIGITGMVIGLSLVFQQGDVGDQVRNSKNGFKVGQSSFQIRPNNKLTTNIPVLNPTLGDYLVDYMSDEPNAPAKTTTNYRVYVAINTENGKKRTYLIGKMVNGVLAASTKGSQNERIIPHSMLNIINCYASYIKKHHLEDDFKNVAKVKYSNKYLDHNYHPILVMEDKNGQVLHLKPSSSVKVDNVLLTK